MSTINEFFEAHPNFRSAVRVFVYTFLATFVPAILGFLGNVLDWTAQDGAVFPAVEPLGKAVVAAFVGAVAGVIAYVYNKVPVGASSSYNDAA
jgi:1,4-dihydroxy-2-naphthoate octaprenyltransferase